MSLCHREDREEAKSTKLNATFFVIFVRFVRFGVFGVFGVFVMKAVTVMVTSQLPCPAPRRRWPDTHQLPKEDDLPKVVGRVDAHVHHGVADRIGR